MILLDQKVKKKKKGKNRNKPNDNITNCNSFKLKLGFLNKTADDTGTMRVYPAVPLKYLSNFWRILEMSLINCEISLFLSWSANYVIYEAYRATAISSEVNIQTHK